ncbi:MAG: lysozyme inhibitor LprI family protein [Sphingopyxis sp.]|jgi:uncharacterized protein YecT (DUF1311 family)|nr:lysozyme inhibitor LprI family protein [Sphingopyxis sp.]
MIMMMAFALAQANPPHDCSNPITQTDMNICEAAAFLAADRAMNAAWTEARRVMQERDRETARYRDNRDDRPGYYAALLESQRAWLRYRDSQCAIRGYAARGGSMEPMLISGCKRELTDERTAFLRDLVDGEGW